MRVATITFHFVNNFGGILQAYALQEFLKEKLNSEVTIVDYRKPFICFTDMIRLFPVTGCPKELLSGLRTMNQRLKRKDRFASFMSSHLQLTQKRFYTLAGLRNALPKQDAYICGSDQIWNPVITAGVSVPYYLGFADKDSIKIAYAPSFGTSAISEGVKKRVKSLLSDFSGLSAREKGFCKLLKELTGREVEQLIDPVFLLDAAQWGTVAAYVKPEQPYILVYMMQNDKQLYNIVREVKERLGLKVIEISRYAYPTDVVDKVCVDVGPEEFLSLFRSASYVCTNSFHGLAYSVIFHKKFMLKQSLKFGSRITNLLNVLGIDLPSEVTDEWLENDIYSDGNIDARIEIERQKAFSFLKRYIKA